MYYNDFLFVKSPMTNVLSPSRGTKFCFSRGQSFPLKEGHGGGLTPKVSKISFSVRCQPNKKLNPSCPVPPLITDHILPKGISISSYNTFTKKLACHVHIQKHNQDLFEEAHWNQVP